MDRFDIDVMLDGFNVLSLDVEGLEKIDISEIKEGLVLHYERLQKRGLDDYVKFLQRQGNFNASENEASKLVSGYECDLSKIRDMPEDTLRTWIIEYLKMLSRERRKNEKSYLASVLHNGVGW